MKVRKLPCKGPIPLLFSSLVILCLAGCAQDSSILDKEKSQQLEFSVTAHDWNNSNKTSDRKISSRAAPISGNTFDTSKNFNVIADVNKGENWSTEVNNETASYSTANNIWQTSATHYWPGAGSTLNFYAYYPTSISSSIAHTAGSAPVLSYTVPDNTSDQIDILAASKTGVPGDSYNQTPVDFKHILAALQFRVGSSGLPSGTITKITLNNVQYKGAYSLDGTWTQDTADKKSFSQTVSSSTSAATVITSGVTTFMMMPQILSDVSITVTYSNGGTLTKTITGTWEAGNSYIYNLNKSESVVVGQYLFSDGTWGSYDSNKTVIGIVFSNTTSSTDKSHGWTHGYAMALQNAGSATSTYQWYSSNSGNPTGTNIMTADQIMSDKDGYTHSGYIQTSGYAAGIAAHGYTAKNKSGNAVAAPSGTSSWYLPSIGQWYDICGSLGGMVAASGKAYTETENGWLHWCKGEISEDTNNYSNLCASNLNVYLNALKDKGYCVDLFYDSSKEIYWSSSEYNSCVYNIYFADGNMDLNTDGGRGNKTNSFKVRPAIAF